MTGRVIVALGVVVTVASCAALFDEPVQCQTDRDCERFGAVCDVANAVCVSRTALPDGGDDGFVPSPSGEAGADGGVGARCNVSPKPTSTIGSKIAGPDGGPAAEITGAVTLDCDKDWILDAELFVRSGATLTIAPGTTIRAKKGPRVSIVVSPGGRIVANGQREAPIVMTSDEPAPAAGDWRGVFVLGVAPPAGQGPFEDDPVLAWGGANADDDSGVLSFVRVEYARNGVVFAGVGRGTKVDFVDVRRTIDNCFMFYGGTVDSKHLVCQFPGDEQFEFMLGFAGRAQFLFGQKTPLGGVFGRHGLLVDDAFPVVYNMTLCGDSQPANGYGIVFRDNAKLDLNDVIVTGWFSGLDATGTLGMPLDMRGSIVFGNATNPAYVEDPAETDVNLPTFNDDNGFDEIGFVRAPASGNVETDPGLLGCFDAVNPQPWPATPITAAARTPPDDGFFDPTAAYVGAFKDRNDAWMKGAWVRFGDD